MKLFKEGIKMMLMTAWMHRLVCIFVVSKQQNILSHGKTHKQGHAMNKMGKGYL